jgi:hypothetical protein
MRGIGRDHDCAPHFGVSTLLCTEVGSDLNCLCVGGVIFFAHAFFLHARCWVLPQSRITWGGTFFELGAYSNILYF